MLLTMPTEIQSLIISFLPRRGMVAVACTCQHFHAVAIRVLYRRVELRSLAQADAFFRPSTILHKGTPAETKHAESKRAQWEAIKILVLRTAWDDRSRSLGTLPRSLRGRAVEPIDVEELQFFPHDDHLRSLMPLLRCFNPRKIHMAIGWVRDPELERSLAATGWKDVTQLTLYGGSGELAQSQTSLRAAKSVVLSKASTATLVDRYRALFTPMEPVFRFDVALLVRLCPNLDELKIVTTTSSTFRSRIEEIVHGGMAGKPADFFSVELEIKS